MSYLQRYEFYRRAAEDALRAAVPGDVPQPLCDAMRYSLLAGGKRLRPVLLLAAYAALQEDITAALPFAAAVEMVHTYSLVHDDLPAMDDDDLRRGKPSCHKVFGEGMAVLAGDGLLSLAFETLAQSAHPRAPAALRELALRCGTRGMVAGQCADLQAAEAGGDAALLAYIHRHKTADMLTAPVVMGLLLADADADALDCGRAYGQALGMAFQIVDDLLDVQGDSAALGKLTGKDARAGKCTWPALRGVEGAREDARLYTAQAAEAARGLKNSAFFFKTLAQRALLRVQ